MNDCKHENGNVLFLILIAVALFAALSYAVSSSSRFGSKSASTENSVIQSSRIIQYASSIENAVTRLTVINNCSYYDMDFTPPSHVNFNNQPYSCKIFHPYGGGIAYQEADSDWVTSGGFACGVFKYAGSNSIKNIGLPNMDEWALYLTCVKKDLCITINDKLGITNTGGNPPLQGGAGTIHPISNLGPLEWNFGDIVSTNNETLDYSGFCIEVTTGTAQAGGVGKYLYIHTLLPR